MTSYDTSGDQDDRRRPRPRGKLVDNVDYAMAPGGQVFAYKRNELLTTRGEEALANFKARGVKARVLAQLGRYTLLGDVADPLAEVANLRRAGILAQPNHVFAAHNYYNPNPVFPTPVFPTPVFPTPVFPTGAAGYGCCCPSSCPPHPSNPCGGGCGGHGASANPVFPTPVFPTPVFPTPVFPTPAGGCGCGCGGHQSAGPNPVFPTPVFPTPVFPTPVFPTPVFPTPMRSSARPATPSEAEVAALTTALNTGMSENAARVVVLDTGLAMSDFRPDALSQAPISSAHPDDEDRPDEDDDHGLDPVAGHGTFIAGVVNQVAPGCEVILHRVISTFAWCPEDAIVECIQGLPLDQPEHTILSLSFGGYTLDYPEALASAIADVQAAGMVVVASAGNNATCAPTFPAAFPDVVSVGAIGPNGPAPFTNYGPWVRACAPGVDIVSTFFKDFEGSEPAPASGGIDPDNFAGWAQWSGTSFSAPLVAGALARRMMTDPCKAREAVARVIDAPSLMRIPNLGTVVNVI